MTLMGRCGYCDEWITDAQGRCIVLGVFPSRQSRLWHERCRLESERPMRYVEQPRNSVPMWELLKERRG